MPATIDRSAFPDTQWSTEKIPFTPAGRAAFDAIHPSAGPRQVRSAMSNDLQESGNPTGLFRDLMYSANGRNFEMVQHPDKVIQLFSAGRHWRIIYTDGRPVPEEVAAGPFWYGYSVGKWEADTLVVHTLALDDRTWLDDWGLPTGPDTRVEERWKRIAPQKLQLTITVSDAVFFTKPWTSTPMVYDLTPPGTEPYEMIYAPVDLEHFNKTLLLPSASAGIGGESR
jgi:hypothetical protein